MEQITITQLTPESFRELVADIIREQIQDFHKDPPDQLLTRTELAKRLGISLPTLRAYTTTNLIKSRKIGSRVYYRWSDVLESAIPVSHGKNSK